MIARKAPGEGRMYQFEGDTDALKDAIKQKLQMIWQTKQSTYLSQLQTI